MMLARTLTSATLLFLAVVFVIPAPAAAQEPSLPPVKIGVVLPLTGGWASWGQKIRQGLELSRDELKHKFEFDYQDEGLCEVAKGLDAVRYLLAGGAKILIIGCVATTRAASPVLKSEGVVAFSAGLLDRKSFESGAMVVNFATQVGTEAEYQADYIVRQGYKSVGIVRPQEPFGEELAQVLKESLKAKEVEVLFDDSDAYTSNDFGPTILKIRQKRPKVLVINLSEAQQIAFLRKFHEAALSTPIISTYGLESNVTSKDNIKYLEGVTYTYPFNSAGQSGAKLDFDKRFITRFGANEQPNANAYFVHDGLKVLDAALDKCRQNTGCIFEYFTNLGGVEGISGRVEYRKDGSTNRPYRMKRVVDGKFVWLE